MRLAICWSGSSHLHLLRQKSNSSSHIVTPFMDSDTFKRLINVPRYTSSSLAFTLNETDHINVVFCKFAFAYSLMSRVISSSNSIVTANSDVYHQSPLMDK